MDHHDAGRELAGVGVHAGVVVEIAVGGLEVDPRRDPPAADREEREADRAVGAGQLEQPADEDPALVPAGGRREEAGRAPAPLVEVDERLEVADGIGRVVEADLADRLGPADLAPDLVALLLAERREVAVEVDAVRQRHDRAHVLALDVERPALADLPGTERRAERVGRRVAAAEAAEVDDVPGRGVGVGEVRDDGRRRVRQVRRCREDRRVVGVVRGAEEDRRGVGGHGRQVGVGVAAEARPGVGVVRLDLVPVHERHDRDRRRAAVGRRVGVDQGERLVMGVGAVAVPPRALERPAGERCRPRVRGREAVPGRGREGLQRAPLGAKSRTGRRIGNAVDIVAGRTGRLHVEGDGGHARTIAPDALGWLRPQRRRRTGPGRQAEAAGATGGAGTASAGGARRDRQTTSAATSTAPSVAANGTGTATTNPASSVVAGIASDV